jgi:hypothetical protein
MKIGQGYIILLTTKTRQSFFFSQRNLLPKLKVQLTFALAAGAQYVGTIFAAAGIYTGNALLLRLVHVLLTRRGLAK